MSSLSGIEFTLQQLRAALRQESLALIAAPGRARPDELKYHTATLKLQALAERLRLALRELDNRDQLQQLRGRLLHDVPREARYSARQSIEGSLAEIERVRGLAVEAVNELLRIDAARHEPPSVHDMLRGLQTIAGGAARRADEAQGLQQMIQVRHDGVSLRATPPPHATAADLANLMLTAVTLAAWLIQRLRR